MIFQILIYGLVAGTQVLLMALALHLVYAVSRVQNLALGAIAASVAYSLYWVIQPEAALPLFLKILIPFLVIFILGTVNFFLNESFTKKQEYLLALLVSFSFGIVLESLLAIGFGSGGRSFFKEITPIFYFGNYQVPWSGIGLFSFGAVIASVALFIVRFTVWGRVLQAIAENHFSAMSIGLNQVKIRYFIYILASFVVGIVGILAGLNTALTPNMGFYLIVMAFIAFLVGGIMDFRGTIVASYLVVLIPYLIIGLVPGVSLNWFMALIFIVAFVLLAWRPKGLFANKQRQN